MSDRLLADLLLLHEQLAAAMATPGVRAAQQLTAGVLPVLEPVWNVLAGEGNGVGFVRDKGDQRELTKKVVRTYRSLDLAGPDMRAVWLSLSKPAEALVDSIRHPLRARRIDEHVQAALTPVVRPSLPSSLLSDWRDDAEAVPALRRVLRMWCDIARNSTGERREVARLTLAAAMLARGAVLDGDVETVKWFVKRWLGLMVTESRVDGTSAALLEQGWYRCSVDEEFSGIRDSVTDLRVEAKYQHRVHRPVWETQLRGRPVELLDEAMARSLPSRDEDTLEAVSLNLRNLQIQSVLQTLTDQQREVVQRFYQGQSLTKLAEEMGISRYRATLVYSKTMSKLRHPLRSQTLRDYL